MTYRGDVYFFSVPVSVFRDCTCWHALSLIRALHVYLLSLSHSFSHSFSLSTISRSETEDGEITGSDELEG
ncbi:hypothetical protein SLEP1_g22201 [Rubroshorea leprosula]|uniref:Uncharacterized protein n=1 Tax=Rubroshorea leprosula TaxID=152421 RepID=A0AAV5JDT2_9ROSI|nr:hypothetical protein SLEP1_g22201 [Rubroshorea leprosula]